MTSREKKLCGTNRKYIYSLKASYWSTNIDLKGQVQMASVFLCPIVLKSNARIYAFMEQTKLVRATQ